MGLVYVCIASLLAASANLCLRKNAEQQKKAHGYLTLYFASSFLISFLVARVSFEHFRFVIPCIGAVAGMLNFAMMGLLALAVQTGPSGLTFSFQNSASVFPPLALFLIFGSAFGFQLTFLLLVGFCLVIAGLFLSARKQDDRGLHPQSYIKWLLLAIAVFFIQGIILSLFQWRCLLFQDPPQAHPLVPWKCFIQEDAWFMPGFFLISTALQVVLFAIYEKRWLVWRESALGVMGGLLNGGATFFLLLATKIATTDEKMILFPLFAVGVIFLCNLWGRWIYDERIYWPGMLLCLGGVFIGSLTI